MGLVGGWIRKFIVLSREVRKLIDSKGPFMVKNSVFSTVLHHVRENLIIKYEWAENFVFE